ncbi:MAG: 6-carboxytetrahydropterin synthase [Planctomycetota bacterium]
MPYRICKAFRVENAHMLMKHPEKCKYPHGHSRKVEVMLSGDELDAADMVCDFKAVKLAVGDFLDSFDHAICVNSNDPFLPALQALPGSRLIVYPDTDPTTEVMAKHIYDHIKAAITNDIVYSTPNTHANYRIGKHVKLDRVRLWETVESWAEYWE